MRKVLRAVAAVAFGNAVGVAAVEALAIPANGLIGSPTARTCGSGRKAPTNLAKDSSTESLKA
jgi:hypothetical protein